MWKFWKSVLAVFSESPYSQLYLIADSYTGLGYTGILAHIPDRDFQSRTETAHSMFCTVGLFGYTGFLVYRILKILVPTPVRYMYSTSEWMHLQNKPQFWEKLYSNKFWPAVFIGLTQSVWMKAKLP